MFLKVKLAHTGILWSWRQGGHPVHLLVDAPLQMYPEAHQVELGGGTASPGTRALPQKSLPPSSAKPSGVLSWDLEKSTEGFVEND